jgi:type IV secretory pathway TrbF-like protein
VQPRAEALNHTKDVTQRMACEPGSPQLAISHGSPELNGAGASAADDPYRAAQLAAFFDAERAWKAYDSIRRWLSGSLCLLALSSTANVVLALKPVHEVANYRETSNEITFGGESSHSRTPLSSSVEHALGLWLQRVRNADSDVELMRQNSHLALVTTAKGSPAAVQLTSFLQSDQNPADLGQKMTRTVTSFAASAVSGTNSYQLAWSELTTERGKSQPWHCFGSAAIAPPLIPTDPAIGAVNPSGTYVTGYELHCQPGAQ